MPGGDGTGPNGMGPMTGGGRGFCAVPVSAGGRPFAGRMFGGRGRGYRHCFYATGLPGWMRLQRGLPAFGDFGGTVSKEDEVTMLKSQADFLKQQIEEVQRRIQAIEGQRESEQK